MKKQEKTSAALIALLNRQYKAIRRNLRAIKTAADSENEIDMFSYVKHGKVLDAAFDDTMKSLKNAGETVKFDNSKGEFFLGANRFRFEFTVTSVGYVEIEAPTEQIARMKAEQLADNDKIELTQVSGELQSVTEAV